VLFAQFVTQEARGLFEVVNELRLMRHDLSRMVIDHEPIRTIETQLERKISYPGASFTQFPLLPGVVIIRFESDIRTEEFFREPLQKNTGYKPIEVTFVGHNHFWFRQYVHAISLSQGEDGD
jgi:hypothetical protein